MNTPSSPADITRLICPFIPKNPRQLYDAINPSLKRIGAIGELIAIAAAHEELDTIEDMGCIGDLLKRETDDARTVLDAYQLRGHGHF